MRADAPSHGLKVGDFAVAVEMDAIANGITNRTCRFIDFSPTGAV
jgi:hypothetical protein